MWRFDFSGSHADGIYINKTLGFAFDDALSGRSYVSRLIKASRRTIYQAFLDPDALVSWLPPGA
jgi:hypothetical protein